MQETALRIASAYLASVQMSDGVPYVDFVSEGKDYRAILKKGESDGWMRKFDQYVHALKGKISPFATPTWHNILKPHIDTVPQDELKEYWRNRYEEER
jgi:hypothetical protein